MKKIFFVDRTLLFSLLLLTLLGMGTILLSSYHISLKNKGYPYYYAYNYFLSISIGWVLLLGVLFVPLEKIKQWSIPFFIFSLFLCFLVFLPGIGRKVSGANRWIKINFFSFQPSEIIKIGLIFCLAAMLAFKEQHINSFKRGFVPIFSVILIATGIIAIEPDLSTAIILFLAGFSLVYVNYFSITYLFLTIACLFPLSIYMLQYKSYFISRFIFISPDIDPFGRGYHIIQALKSFHQGGWWGTDSDRLLSLITYFPDTHTDFTFSLLARVGGFVLVLIVLIIFMILIFRCFFITLKQKDNFVKNLGLGISLLISIEVLLHVSVNIGLAPTTGSVLPFISYGRTSMFIHFILIGILLNMSIKYSQTYKTKTSNLEQLKTA